MCPSLCVCQGFVVFAILGYVAHEEGVSVSVVASGGSGLAFIVFPTALALLPAPQFFSLVFFVMLLSLGLGSVVALVEVSCFPYFSSFPTD